MVSVIVKKMKRYLPLSACVQTGHMAYRTFGDIVYTICFTVWLIRFISATFFRTTPEILDTLSHSRGDGNPDKCCVIITSYDTWEPAPRPPALELWKRESIVLTHIYSGGSPVTPCREDTHFVRLWRGIYYPL